MKSTDAHLRRLRRLTVALLILLAATGVWEQHKIAHYRGVTTGTIVEFTRARYGGRGDATPPRIEYTVEGKTYSLIRPRAVWDVFRFHQIGETVPLRFDPARPERAVVDYFWYRCPLTAMFGAMALFFVIAVIWHHVATRGRQGPDNTRKSSPGTGARI